MGGQPDDRELARRHLEAAVAALTQEAMDASLWAGFPGVAWAVEIVEGWLGDDPPDRNGDIDEVLADALSRPHLWPAHNDLVSGAVGSALYALERHPRPAAANSLWSALDRLEDSARHDGAGGVFWWTPPEEIEDPQLRAEYPGGYADLGLAHGVAGPIALLGLLVGRGIDAGRARHLLEGAVRWLRNQAILDDVDPSSGAGPTYPLWVAAGEEPVPARSAWCYGDPGVAAALLLAARQAGTEAWEQHALGVARRAAARPDAETGVRDGGFCHGAAGLAHIFNRLYQHTGDPGLAEAARRWLLRTLDFYDDAIRVGPGWVSGREGGDGPWEGLDVVDGAAGVALVLLSATTTLDPVWDRMFLLS